MRILDEIAILNRPDPTWQIKPFWECGALVDIFGKPGSFKTAIVKGMVFSIATARPWFGHPVTPGRVIWIAGEGQGGLKNRLRAWKKFHSVASLPNLGYCDEPVALKRGHPSLSTFLELGRGFLPSIVAFDSLSDALRAAGLSDKDPEDMDIAIDALKLIRDTLHATVLVIHHTGWTNTNRARGGSNLIAAVDTEILVEAHPKRANVVVFKNTKQREAEFFPTLHCSISVVDLGINKEGEPQSACVVGNTETVSGVPPAPNVGRGGGRAKREMRLGNHI